MAISLCKRYRPSKRQNALLRAGYRQSIMWKQFLCSIELLAPIKPKKARSNFRSLSLPQNVGSPFPLLGQDTQKLGSFGENLAIQFDQGPPRSGGKNVRWSQNRFLGSLGRFGLWSLPFFSVCSHPPADDGLCTENYWVRSRLIIFPPLWGSHWSDCMLKIRPKPSIFRVTGL